MVLILNRLSEAIYSELETIAVGCAILLKNSVNANGPINFSHSVFVEIEVEPHFSATDILKLVTSHSNSRNIDKNSTFIAEITIFQFVFVALFHNSEATRLTEIVISYDERLQRQCIFTLT